MEMLISVCGIYNCEKCEHATADDCPGCLDGNKYRVTCLATTSRGQELQLWAYLTCRAPS